MKTNMNDLVTLSILRVHCCEQVVNSRIGSKSHKFALGLWKFIEQSHPELTPAGWSELLKESNKIE